MKIMKANLIKKTLLHAAAAVVLLAGLSAQADYPSTVLGDGPAGYWRFSETSVVTPVAMTATNLGTVGTANNGNYNGSYTRGVPGALAGSTAAYFTGGAWVQVPNSPTLNPNPPFSVEFWIKPNPVVGQLTCPLSSTDFSPTPRLGWLFYTDDGYSGGYVNGGYYFRAYSDAGTKAIASPAGLLTTNWTHVVGVVDGAHVLLYVNGQLANSTTWNGNFTPNVTQPIGIGTRYDAGFPQDGTMNDVAIYGSALSANDVAAHYEAATTNASGYATQILSANPVGYWRLNEPMDVYPVATNRGMLGSAVNGSYHYWSTTTPDLDGPSYPGFETGNTVLLTSGTNGTVSVPPLNLNTNTVTIEAWVNLNGAQSPWAGFMFSRGATANGLHVGGDGLELHYTWNANSADSYNWASGLSIPPNEWAYVALAIDPNQARLFLGTSNGWSVAANVIPHLSEGFLVPAWIGQDPIGGRFINGEIDETAIYGKTLTEGQLRTHALTGFGDPAHNRPILLSDPPVVSPSGTIYSTTPFSLTADAYGEGPLSFQWIKDGTNIPGAATFIYTRAAAAASDNGNYSVIVTNVYGAVTSTVVSITVNSVVPPTITSQPPSRSVYAGGAASFNIGTDGTPPLRYQWKHAGTNLPGATNATLLVTNCAAAEAGAYAVGVTNVAGGVLSSPANLTLLTPAAGSYAEQVVTNGPLAYWRLNETSGTLAYDYAGGNDGTIANAVTQGANGLSAPAFPGMEVANTGYNFDGASGSVLIGNPASLNFIGQITMVAWVRPADTVGLRNIICHGHQTSPTNAETGLRINAGSYTAWSWDGSVEANAPVPPEDIGNWVHLAGTYDGIAWRLYRNGVQVAATPGTSGAKIAGAVGWAIGARGTGTERFFSGDIDEVAIYNKALSADTISAMYATAAYGSTTAPFVTGNPGSQTVAAGSTATLSGAASGSLPISYQWKKDGVNVPGATAATLSLTNVYFTDAGSYVLWATNGVGHTNTATATLTVMPPPTFANLTNDLVLHLRFDGDYLDTSGRGNDANAVGSPTFLVGKVGQAVHIATTKGNNYLVVSDNAGDLAFEDTNSFTVAFWVRYTDRFNDNPIIGNAINSTWRLGWVFTDEGGNLEWSLVSTDNTSTYLRDPVGPAVIGDGAWHNVVGVVDRGQQMALAYVDGVLDGSWSIAGLGSLNPGNLITIGQDPTGNYGSETFDLDDVGIWRRALTAYEAAGVYGAAQRSGESFDVYGPVKVSVNQIGTDVDVSWQAGTLLESTNVTGTYTAVPGATAPFYRTSPTNSATFFRVRQ